MEKIDELFKQVEEDTKKYKRQEEKQSIAMLNDFLNEYLKDYSATDFSEDEEICDVLIKYFAKIIDFSKIKANNKIGPGMSIALAEDYIGYLPRNFRKKYEEIVENTLVVFDHRDDCGGYYSQENDLIVVSPNYNIIDSSAYLHEVMHASNAPYNLTDEINTNSIFTETLSSFIQGDYHKNYLRYDPVLSKEVKVADKDMYMGLFSVVIRHKVLSAIIDRKYNGEYVTNYFVNELLDSIIREADQYLTSNGKKDKLNYFITIAVQEELNEMMAYVGEYDYERKCIPFTKEHQDYIEKLFEYFKTYHAHYDQRYVISALLLTRMQKMREEKGMDYIMDLNFSLDDISVEGFLSYLDLYDTDNKECNDSSEEKSKKLIKLIGKNYGELKKDLLD